MADITVLRQNAIVRNATTGATPPHGPVKTGELPLVQVKQPPGGPQVQEGQQKPVTILPPKDADSAVKTGGLPMVKVKMQDGKAKLDDGVDEKVVIRDSKHGAVSSGGLPMIQVKMTDGKPQLQTLPNVQGGPPQIPAAPPALSAPRGAPAPARQGYVARGPLPVQNQYQVSRVAAPQPMIAIAAPPQPQMVLPPIPTMSPDQLLFLRHAADKDLREMRAQAASAQAEVQAPEGAEAPAEAVQVPESVRALIQLAEATLATIDDILVATAVHAEAAAIAAAAPPAPAMPTIATTASGSIARAPSVSAVASRSIAPSPSVSHVAGRVAGPFVAAGVRAQRNSAMAPRRVARPAAAAGPLPMVEVKMDGQRAVVQNQAEIEAAKAALAAAETAPSAPLADTPDSNDTQD